MVPSLEQAKNIGETIAQTTNVTRFISDDSRVDVVVHDDVTNDDRQIVFVCNPTDQTITTHVSVDRTLVSARELWNDVMLNVANGGLDLTLEPYTIMICDCAVN